MPREDAHFKSEDRALPTRVETAREQDELPSEPAFDPEDLASAGDEQQFRRAERRVPVRRGPLPKKTASRLKIVLAALAMFSLCGVAYGAIYRYGSHSWRFRVESSDDISVTGLHNVSRSQVMDVLGADIGRNVFFIPLEDRKRQLEQIAWVKSAAVMRLLPNHLAVDVQERTPVAFVQIGSRVALIDNDGIIMDLPRGANYSFPVIVGFGDAEPTSTRAARMRIYDRLVRELDSEGRRYSQDLSEVDLSDPEDVKITVSSQPAGSEPAPNGGAVLIHLGNEQFLSRYKMFIAHVAEWRQQFQQLDSVDLRYDRQVIVNPESAAQPATKKK